MTENNNNNPNTDDSVDQPQSQSQNETAKRSVSDAEAKLIKEVMEKKAQIKEQTEKLASLQKTIEGFGGVDAIKALIDEKAKAEAAKKEAEKEALERRANGTSSRLRWLMSMPRPLKSLRRRFLN